MSDTTIKSVRRVFEILELFDRERRPLLVKEISRMLGYPLTSTHALLKSMHDLGYADLDAPNWTYTPSRQILLTTEWVNDLLDREQNLLDLIAMLNQETKETVNLSRLSRDQAKIIYGLESLHPIGVSVKVGTQMPVDRSLTGMALLSQLKKANYLEYLKTVNSGPTSKNNGELIEGVIAELEQYGSVARCDLFIEGIGAVCVPIRTSITNETMVIGIVGPSHRISQRAHEHRETLKHLAEKHNVQCVYALRTPPDKA